jgi:hypothetical protein
MNLYGKLGTPPYSNYVEWSHDIYRPNESPLREIQRVDIKDRLLWGGLKNLISGATTVVHHNPWHRMLGKDDFPVRVLKNITWAHSLALEKNLNRSKIKTDITPFIIHAGEGTDLFALSEIPKLEALGLLQKNTVLIHAVALVDSSIATLQARQAAIVWCPESNRFLLHATTPVAKIKNLIPVAIGTDATLTGSATLLDEMRVSAHTKGVTPADIFNMVTRIPARIFHLPNSEIGPQGPADFFVTPIRDRDYYKNLLHATPADMTTVFVRGEMKLLDASIPDPVNVFKHYFHTAGARKKTTIDVVSLKTRINKTVSAAVLEKNSLWTLIEI